ncbi:MAG: winged helix-turn-helix domain-containing protein [Bryobacteraceae bacterium]|nr:winged helix-turn-helix domain-containing protein [Bryobacteraceae bacterium]
MPDQRPLIDAYRFGPFRLSIHNRLLERAGERIPLTPKVIDTLFVLVENRGQVVTKESLMKAVWPDVNVVESGLTRNISALRKALEEGESEGTYIETIPRRGYRFVADVQTEMQEEATAPLAPPLAPAPSPAPPETAPPPAPRPSRRRSILALSALALAAVAGVTFLPREKARPSAAPPEPLVKIGEHLLYKLAPDETRRAVEHFERAVGANSKSASAQAGLSIALLQLTVFGVQTPAQVMPRADAAARQALVLNPSLSTAHYASAMVQLYGRWNIAAAETAFKKALELDPASVQTRLSYSRLKLVTGEPKEAARMLEAALELDPASPAVGADYCRVFYSLRDFRRAEAECRKVLDREPRYALAHYYLALSLGWLGRYDDAARSLDESGLVPGVLEADRAWLALRQGDRRPALAVLENRRQLVARRTVDATAKLLLAGMLGFTDEAYEAAEAGLAGRAPEILMLDSEPRLDAVHNDPRYPAFMRKAGLPVRQ